VAKEPEELKATTADDGSLRHGLCFYFEGEFHLRSQWRQGKSKKGLEEEGV